MAKVKRQVFQTWTNASLTSFFESFNSDRVTSITTSGNDTTVMFTDNMGLLFDLRTNPPSDWMGVYGIINGGQTGRLVQPCAVGTITCAIGDNIVYVALTDGYPRKMLFFYTKLNDNVYYCTAGSGDNKASFYNLSGRTLTRVSDSSTFNYGNALNYSRTLGSVDYIDSAPLYTGTTVTKLTDTDMKSCTAVTPDTMLTFNGDNYYAVGSHLIIPMTD